VIPLRKEELFDGKWARKYQEEGEAVEGTQIGFQIAKG